MFWIGMGEWMSNGGWVWLRGFDMIMGQIWLGSWWYDFFGSHDSVASFGD